MVFQFRASADTQYNRSNLAAEGVVVVSFNCRLAVFGFLALPELDADGTLSGSYGIQDPIATLKWVQANIAAFGGDPDNVTIFGQSAGAHPVGILLASPRADGLFAQIS
jgi:para-nitrobenzyl esterase